MTDIQTSKTSKRVSIFISYAHKDEELLKELIKHLSFLDRLDLIDIWHSRKIEPGENFSAAIHTSLNTAHLILLLISPDFIASKYCYRIETGRALERYTAGEARVIPIILRSTNWKELPISKLQALPTDGKPAMSWPSLDDALSDVAQGIFKIITAIKAERMPGDVMEPLPQMKKNTAIEPPKTLGRNSPPDRANTYVQQGQILFHAGNYQQALQVYETARHLDPSNSSIYRAMGECLTLLDRLDEAFVMYKQVAHLEAARYRNKGDMLYALGDYNTALEAYDIAIGLAPYVAETYMRKGDLYKHIGQWAEADNAYQQARELLDA
jgi:TIR domain/Tetratricopeptide repeat